VKELKQFLTKSVNGVKEAMTEGYFSRFLNKVVEIINRHFMTSLYKFTKFEENFLPILMIDITEIENNLASYGKGVSSYTNYVGKTFSKTKAILKLLSMPKNSFLENFKNFFEDAT